MKTEPQAKACTLSEWIDEHFDGNQRAFAAAQGVQPPQVTQWIKKDFIVVDCCLYSPRRSLKTQQSPKRRLR